MLVDKTYKNWYNENILNSEVIMSHEQLATAPQSPETADMQEIEDYANNQEVVNSYEFTQSTETSRRLGEVTFGLVANETGELPADQASEQELHLREAYVDREFPNGMQFTIGTETYQVTGVSFTGDGGNYTTEKVTIQHMAAEGETLTMEPEYLKQWIAAAEAQAVAGEQLLGDAEYAEIGTEIIEQYATNSNVIRALGGTVLNQEVQEVADILLMPEIEDTEVLAEQLRNWIDEYDELGFSTNDEIKIRGETYTVKDISLAGEAKNTDSQVTIQHTGAGKETFILTPEELQALIA